MRRCAVRPWAAALAAIGIALAGGCASFNVEDTTPLSPDQLAAQGSERISKGGYRLASLANPSGAPDMLVLVAMSGGGKRSAAFAYGALEGMREVQVPTPAGSRPLLGEIDAISGVSGGSFPAAYYGLYREAAFGKFEEEFLYQDTES